MKASVFVALACAARSVTAQDAPAPENVRGLWEGTLASGFAQKNPADATSLECLAPGTTISTPHSINISADGFATHIFPYAAVVVPNVGTLPAYAGLVATWASTAGSVGSLRVSPTTLQCYEFVVTGDGAGRKLNWVNLGGEGYTWQQQCAPATYSDIADVHSKRERRRRRRRGGAGGGWWRRRRAPRLRAPPPPTSRVLRGWGVRGLRPPSPLRADRTCAPPAPQPTARRPRRAPPRRTSPPSSARTRTRAAASRAPQRALSTPPLRLSSPRQRSPQRTGAHEGARVRPPA